MSTRREFFALAAVASVLGRHANAQSLASAVIYRDYSRCLPEHLAELALAAYRRRERALSMLADDGAIRARQEWVRETFWDLVGGMPARTPLNLRTTGSFERPGYRVEKLVYESQPQLIVAANLYIPTAGTPPYPGVVFQPGHSTNGKCYVQYQRCCQGLAKLGFLVLTFDPMGQGERTYYPGEKPFESALGADEEHTRPGRQMLLKGDTSTRLQTWDAVRSLDVLASHPLVDAARLASTGQSGGGTNTMLLAAADDRLAAAAISCPNTENVGIENFNSPGSTDDAEQNFIGGGPAGFARWDLLYPLAPRPLLVAVSERDFFGTYSPRYISNGIEEFRKLAHVYELLGSRDRIEWYSTALPHGLAHDMRMQIYRWLGRWLKPAGGVPEAEPETQPEEDAQLYASPSGSVVVSFASKTPFLLNRELEMERKPKDLAALIGVWAPLREEPLVTLGEASYGDVSIDAVEVRSANSVWVPAWLFRPRNDRPDRPLVVTLHPSGRIEWREGGLLHELARDGWVACAPDLRNQGDLRPEFGRGARGHADLHNSEEHYAWSSLILGQPLLGQRVTDLLALVRGLLARPEWSNRRVVVAARGFTTIPALCAAALENRIAGLYLAGGLISFANLCATENYEHPFGNFVPNFLLHTDLPAIAAKLAPKPVVIAGAVNGAGASLKEAEIRSAYAGSEDTRHLQIREQMQWDANSIGAFAKALG